MPATTGSAGTRPRHRPRGSPMPTTRRPGSRGVVAHLLQHVRATRHPTEPPVVRCVRQTRHQPELGAEGGHRRRDGAVRDRGIGDGEPVPVTHDGPATGHSKGSTTASGTRKARTSRGDSCGSSSRACARSSASHSMPARRHRWGKWSANAGSSPSTATNRPPVSSMQCGASRLQALGLAAAFGRRRRVARDVACARVQQASGCRPTRRHSGPPGRSGRSGCRAAPDRASRRCRSHRRRRSAPRFRASSRPAGLGKASVFTRAGPADRARGSCVRCCRACPATGRSGSRSARRRSARRGSGRGRRSACGSCGRA